MLNPFCAFEPNRAILIFRMPKEESSDKRYKLRISSGDDLDTYDISPGVKDAFPLKYGNGCYHVVLYEQTYDNKYAAVWNKDIDAKLDDPTAWCLYPNQYVNYSTDIKHLANKFHSYEEVCHFIKQNFSYDYIKAIRKVSGMLPDIQETLETHMGICQDLSALTVALLRCAGIKSKLVIGYADQRYHAWVESYVDGEKRRFDPTVELYGISRPINYTAERAY